MTPTGVNVGGGADDVDETPMKKMVDRIIKHTTPARPATRPGTRLPVKRKLGIPPQRLEWCGGGLPLYYDGVLLELAASRVTKQDSGYGLQEGAP